MRYQRIMMKLSGSAMSGERAWGFDPNVFDFDAPGDMFKIFAGDDIGTRIGDANKE